MSIPPYYPENDLKGMIIGSIAIKVERPIFDSYSFIYSRVVTGKPLAKNTILIQPTGSYTQPFKPDIYDGYKAVYYFSIRGPEGDYVFHNVEIGKQIFKITKTLKSAIALHCNIEKGKVKYLGEIYVDYNAFQIEFNSQQERDKEYLSQKYPNLKIEYK